MYKVFSFVIIAGCALANCTSAQPQIECKEVDFSSQQKFWTSRIKDDKSIDLKNQFNLMINGKEFFGTRKNGLIYMFDMDQEKIVENRITLINDGYTEPTDYFVDKDVIAWVQRRSRAIVPDSIYVVKYYDYEKKSCKERTFVAPREKLLKSNPVIIDTNKILSDNIILYSDKRSPDTLDISKMKVGTNSEGHTFMRRNMYLTDNCFEALERCSKEFHGLSFTKIEGNRLVTYDLDPRNISVPINTYRIEADFKSLILMSSKTEPHKFLLYDIDNHFAYLFQLDKELFNLKRLVGTEEVESGDGNDEFPPNEVRFSYTCSMDNKNIYIRTVFKPDNKFKTYKVPDYKRIIR